MPSDLPQRILDTRYAPIIPVPCGSLASRELLRAPAQSDADCARVAALTGFELQSSRLSDHKQSVSPQARARPLLRTETVAAQDPLVRSRPLHRDRSGCR